MAYTYDSKGNLIPTPGSSTGPGSPEPHTTPMPEGYTFSPLGSVFGAVAVPPEAQTGIPEPQPASNVSAPGTNMQPGQKGTDVKQLQDWLVQMGYLTPQQLTGNVGAYDSNTTAAVAKLQSDLGVKAGSSAGYYGPQTQAAIAQKYQSAFASVNKGQTPDQSGVAQQRIQDAITSQSSNTTDPVLGSISSSLAPIMGALTQVLNNINNPALTGVSLQQEYADLASQAGLPTMQTSMLNMQRIMNGTEDDIRSEISSAGGTVTESQVLGMTAARNNVILKQYKAVATSYQAAKDQIDSMMSYAATDQQTALTRQNMVAGIAGNMASIESQMMTMGFNMQKFASDNLNKVVTNIGYTGLAQQAGGDPSVLSSYERALGLAPGALSDKSSLQQMETYRQQQLKMGQQRIVLQYGVGDTTIPGTNTDGLISPPASSPTSANGGDILSATGLSVPVFNYLTQGTQSMSRMSAGQRNQIMAQASKWLQGNGVDISTLQSQYKSYNDVLSANISRYNKTKIMESELLGTVDNLKSVVKDAELSRVNVGNVAKVWAGQQVNDPLATQYAFHFQQLKNELAGYFAASQGKNSPDVIDNQDAANAVMSGMSTGSLNGFRSSIENSTSKMGAVLSNSVDSARKDVWSLFNVGDKYQSPNRPIQVLSPDGKTRGTIPMSQLKDALAQGYSQI